MLADGYGTTSQGVAKARFVQLQIAVLQNDGVVLGNRALRLDGKYPVQVLASAFTERRAFLGCRFGEPAIELCNVALAQERVRLLECADSSQT